MNISPAGILRIQREKQAGENTAPGKANKGRIRRTHFLDNYHLCYRLMMDSVTVAEEQKNNQQISMDSRNMPTRPESCYQDRPGRRKQREQKSLKQPSDNNGQYFTGVNSVPGVILRAITYSALFTTSRGMCSDTFPILWMKKLSHQEDIRTCPKPPSSLGGSGRIHPHNLRPGPTPGPHAAALVTLQ